MNKTQLIDALAARYEGNRKAAAHALDSVLDTITREVVKGEIDGDGGVDDLAGPAVSQQEAGAQALVAANELGEAALQHGDIQRAL